MSSSLNAYGRSTLEVGEHHGSGGYKTLVDPAEFKPLHADEVDPDK